MKSSHSKKVVLIFLLITAIGLSLASCTPKEDLANTSSTAAGGDTSLSETLNTQNSNETTAYTREANGLTLSVSVPKEVPHGERFICVAKITNNTDSTVEYTIPVYDENAHKQIEVSIGTTGKEFIDCDTFGKGYGDAVMNLILDAHESYSERIEFLPGYQTGGSWQKLDEAEIAYLPRGDYKGISKFSWNAESDAKEISLEFIISVC
ncbi:MAG TPA: hypothetical protein P5127_00380 [Oscillospiraceae bacterium]|jgi:hypothetical protein|nr:hypothetical protein [Oscillospiraceae bacterium]